MNHAAFVSVCTLELILGAPLLAAPDKPLPWADSLVSAGGGVWKARAVIEIVNGADEPLEGIIRHIDIGMSAGQVDLVGQSAEAVRVCDALNRELLFGFTDSGGCSKRAGLLTTGDRLSFRIDCPAAKAGQDKEGASRTRYLIYFDNARAVSPPDHARPGLVNGGFESGKTSPDDWDTLSADAQHRVDWVADAPHGGRRCIRTTVEAGSPSTWVQAGQSDIPVQPGARYRLTAWVRAQDVRGTAGWYVHVHADRPMVVNQIANAGEGSYDWRKITLDFTAPAKARSATVGTVLHGTGTAWFDDVSLESLDAGNNPRVVSIAVERLALTEAPGTSDWLLPRDRWPARATVWATNLDDRPLDHVAVSAELKREIHQVAKTAKSVRVAVLDPTRDQSATEKDRLTTARFGRRVVFVASVPPRTRKAFHVYLGSSPEPEEDVKAMYAALVRSPVNLVRNPDFETGGDLPESWQPPTGWPAQGNDQCTLARERGGLFGDHCAKLEVPPGAPLAWSGWHQGPVPIQPGATYFYAGWLKTKGVSDGGVTLHAHWHQANGQLAKESPFISTHGHATGDSDWALFQTVAQAPADAASAQLHLTMNAHGTVWHDGILFCRGIESVVGSFQTAGTVSVSEDRPLRVWQVNPLVKVFRDDLPGPPATDLRVSSAANEREPIQLVVRSGKPLRNVRVEVSALKNGGGSLPPVRMDCVGYVPVDKPSAYYISKLPAWYRLVPIGTPSTDGWAGDWPDPLPPCRTFDLPADQSQPIWLTISVPAGTAAGTYAGHVTIQADGIPPMQLPLDVEVWPFELPDTPSLKVTFDLRDGPGWNLFGGKPISEMRKWYTLLADHRVSPGLLPQPGFKYENGRVELDTKAFDEAARVCLDELKMSTFYSPDFLYSFGWAYTPRPLFGHAFPSEDYRKAYTACYRAYLEHLKKNGWYDRVTHYLCDEPHYTHAHVVDQMKKLCEMIQSVDRQVPIYVSTWQYVPAWDGCITQWGIGQYGCFPVDAIAKRQAAGDRFWFTTDGQQALDTPYLATERLLPYYCFKYGVLGYEFWGVSWWTYDPWERGWHKFISQSDEGKVSYWVRYPDGDGYLTYPGERVGLDRPVSSIRLEMVREGIEDYEYLRILQALVYKARGKASADAIAAADKALDQARSLVTIPNAGGLRSTEILPNPDVVPPVRLEVARQIVALKKAMNP